MKADQDGSLPVEPTICLLAMQCVVRGQSPSELRVMVPVGENLMDGLVPRANKLIQACMATVVRVPIIQRQQEVHRGILQNLSNKEIASKLNNAERAAKFHVSALLHKLHVSGWGGLIEKAGELLPNDRAPSEPFLFNLIGRVTPAAGPLGPTREPKLVRLTASEGRAR